VVGIAEDALDHVDAWRPELRVALACLEFGARARRWAAARNVPDRLPPLTPATQRGLACRPA
jgi:hypothetical protein